MNKKKIIKKSNLFKDDFDMEKCYICKDKWRYNFERELESRKPNYLMSVWYENKSFIQKNITKKKTCLGRNTDKVFICLDCALKINKSLMRHLENTNIFRMKMEDEKGV